MSAKADPKERELTIPMSEAIDLIDFSTVGPGVKLPGIEWTCFLTAVSCCTKLIECKKMLDAARDPKNLAEDKPETKRKKLVQSWEEFSKEKAALQKQHAKKDENGQPLVINFANGTSQYIFEDEEAFNKEYKELEEKHQAAVDARNEQIKRVNEKLESEVKVKLPTIAKKDLPKDVTRECLGPLAKLLVAK